MAVRAPLWAVVALLVAACGAEPSSSPTDAPGKPAAQGFEQMWTTAQRAHRRTCPSERCGSVGELMFREGARVYETRDGWARTTEPYDASCRGGRSEFVDSGQAACTEANGITNGRFAEWVQLSSLGRDRPADPALTASADEGLIAQSDDFTQYRRAFVAAAAQLFADGRCTRADFQEMGGWVKSVNQYRNEPVYFTYCGGMTNANKIYLNAETGRIFR